MALRWLVLCSPLLVPWVVVRTTATTLVLPWGLVLLETGDFVSLPDYLEATAGLPRYLEMWFLGVACYAFALAWAAGRRFGTDQRVTAGLFVLAAVCIAWLSSGLATDPYSTAVPLGSIHALALAVWTYASAGGWTRTA